MHTKRASTLKLETAVNALNLSKGDAKCFIQVHSQTTCLLPACNLHSCYDSIQALQLDFLCEDSNITLRFLIYTQHHKLPLHAASLYFQLLLQELQAVKGKVEQLTAERDAALSESVIVRQQRNCHADHAQLLVNENKRLSMQLQMLRTQQPCSEQSSAEKLTPKVKASMQTKPVLGSTQTGTVNENTAQRGGKHSFDGSNIKNVLHKKPFDLSKGSAQQPNKASNTILAQAQQIRAAAWTQGQL